MKKHLIKIWENEFIQGSIIFTFASFIASILNYLFSLLSARGLGPKGFGEITALFSYSMIFSVPIVVLTLVIIQKIGARGESGKSFAIALEKWFIQKIKKWWFLGIPMLLVIPFIPRLTNLSPISGYFLLPLIIVGFISAFYGSLLQGVKLFFWFSLIGILTALIKLIGAILVVLGIDGIFTVVLFVFISSFLGLTFSHMLLKNKVDQKEKNKLESLDKKLFDILKDRQLIITFLSILAITLLNNADIIFVKKFFNATEAGIYGSWSLFAKIIFYFIGPVSAISYVFFSNKTAENTHKRTFAGSLIVLLMVGIVSFVFYNFFAFFIINLFFGSRFLAVSPYLSQASIFGSLYSAITFINNFYLAKKSNKSLILAAAFPIYIISLFMIPKKIDAVINLNIFFSLSVTIIYLVVYGQSFIYNKADGTNSSV